MASSSGRLGAHQAVGQPEAAQDDQSDDRFVPLSRDEALALRQRMPSLSLWRVVGLQLLMACVVAGLAGLLTGRSNVMWSAGYGGMAVVLPAALFARGLSRQAGVGQGNSALTGFFVWEMAKIGMTLAMLLLAPRWVKDLSWLALVAGFVVTMKVYWLAVWLRLAPSSKVKKT